MKRALGQVCMKVSEKGRFLLWVWHTCVRKRGLSGALSSLHCVFFCDRYHYICICISRAFAAG